MTNEDKKEAIVAALMEILNRMDDEELDAYYYAANIISELKDYIPTGKPN